MNRSVRRLAKSYALAILIVPVIQLTARGQNAAWVNPLGGFYGEPSNWALFPSGVPGPTNDILINVAGAYDIGFQSDHTARDLSISNNIDLTFSSGGPGGVEHTYALTGAASIDSASLTLGELTQGRRLHVDIDGALNMAGGELTLLNGAQLTTLPSLANSNSIEGAGAVAGQVEVRGADPEGQASRWQSGGGFTVGGSGGPSSFTVADGGQASSMSTIQIGGDVSADGSSLEVRGTSLDGTPSSLTGNSFTLGFLNAGGGLSIATAQVADGALVSTGNVQVRKDSRVIIETEDVDRNPSRWEAGSFDVAGGFVDILAGGHLSSDFVNLNRLAIARVNGTGADGRPSRWDVNGNIRLGSDNGFGSLLIDSGHVTSDTGQIGVGSGDSLFSLEGAPGAIGVWENSGDVSVGGSLTGPEASGNLRLFDDHACVDIGGTLTIWGAGVGAH